MDEDFIDELMDDDENEGQQLEETQNSDDVIDDHQQEDNSYNEVGDDDSFISDLLRSRGIEDLSKIKFENDEGEIEEVDWNTLSKEDKLNIFNSSAQNPDTDLDEDEIQLINTIRRSQLSPSEYIDHISNMSVANYQNTLKNQSQSYSVDQYTDEELFVMDLLTKTDDITEEEAIEALEKAKSNEDLFKKQMGAVRNDYKSAENQQIQLQQQQKQQQAQEQYNQFAENIENSIINFTEFSGCELNMTNEDMNQLYTFITGFDSAGNSWFGKALKDPDTVVKMAWFALNGEQMISDINDYYKKEIAKVRKEAKNSSKKDTQVVYKPNQKPSRSKQEVFDDLDDF